VQVDFLRRAEAGDRLAHAMLFAGPAGIGKRLVADAVAGGMICERHEANACGTCSACRQLAAGSHPDVMIVEVPAGKREIPIDRVRQLNQFLRLQPIHSARKVAIVDDAHLLNLPAQNALLKGLEEPPPGSLTILIAHNADALLPTVRSRCQRLLFGPLPDAALTALLVDRLGVPTDEVQDLAALAEGSPGRALRLRKLLPAEPRHALLDRLARLNRARYGALVKLANELSASDELTSLALETLLRTYRQEAVQCAERDVSSKVAEITGRADLVTDALRTLRRRNVNRQLLLESLLVRLARA